MIAPLLRKGDGVRVITPARSMMLPWMTDAVKQRARERLEALGLVVSFGQHVNDNDMFDSTTVERRIEDLHDAFTDPTVTLILSVIGGFNSNQLLPSIDYDLIKRNPKRLCGYSDITALSNAIYAKTGLVTYSGPHFINFGQAEGFDYTHDAFTRCHFESGPFSITPSDGFYDGYWANGGLPLLRNAGWMIHAEGEAIGTIIGANLCTFALLNGTEYQPNPSGDIILFLEDDQETSPVEFDRQLQTVFYQRFASRIKALVIGRFETHHIKTKENEEKRVTPEKLHALLASKRELKGIPIISGVDFGHTTPMATFPIGGTAAIIAKEGGSRIEILTH